MIERTKRGGQIQAVDQPVAAHVGACSHDLFRYACQVRSRRLRWMSEIPIWLPAQQRDLASQVCQQPFAQATSRAMIGIEQHAKRSLANG